jgi:transcriptional regulator with XRE-family HTH domain
MSRRVLVDVDERMYLDMLGRNVRDYREGQKLTQKEVADMAGLSRGHYASIERGFEPASLRAYLRIAVALSVDLKELLP